MAALGNIVQKKSGKQAKKKKVKKGKKRKQMDDISTELAAENTKKELVATLVGKTEMSEENILAAFDDFNEEYPKGKISEKQFVNQSKVWLLRQIFL